VEKLKENELKAKVESPKPGVGQATHYHHTHGSRHYVAHCHCQHEYSPSESGSTSPPIFRPTCYCGEWAEAFHHHHRSHHVAYRFHHKVNCFHRHDLDKSESDLRYHEVGQGKGSTVQTVIKSYIITIHVDVHVEDEVHAQDLVRIHPCQKTV